MGHTTRSVGSDNECRRKLMKRPIPVIEKNMTACIYNPIFNRATYIARFIQKDKALA